MLLIVFKQKLFQIPVYSSQKNNHIFYYSSSTLNGQDTYTGRFDFIPTNFIDVNNW